MMRKSMPMIRRFGLLLAAVILWMTSFSCGKEESPYGGTAVLSTLTMPEGLNPLLYQDTVSNHLGAMIFNKLIWLDERSEPMGDLADSWEISSDNLVWTFHLKEGVRFHDGVELTAEDVAFTFNTIRDPAVRSPLAPLFGIIKEVEAVDRFQLRIELFEPYASLPYLLILEILPSHHFRESGIQNPEFAEHPVGTGPFQFSERKEGEIILKANEDYFEGRPYLDEVVLRFYPDKRMAWSALMQAKVDVVSDLELEDYQVIEKDDRFEVHEYLDPFYYTVLFNLEDPVLADEKIRFAIDSAIDREDIIENALSGWAVPTTGPFRPGTWAYNDDVEEAKYDPEAAREILASLGWVDTDDDMILEKDGRELTLSLLADRGDLLKEAVAQRIKWQLFKAGIKVEVEFADQPVIIRERLAPGNYQSVLLQFNAGGDPDKFTFLFWHSSQIGRSNLGSYRNGEVDRLIELGRVESNHTERIKIYQSIHRLIAADRPAAFLFIRRIFLGAQAKYQGILADPALFHRSIKDWQLKEKAQKERR